MIGKIKTLSDRGFGFITGADGTDHFFHFSALANCRFEDLYEDAPVEFERGFDERRGKYMAEPVRLL